MTRTLDKSHLTSYQNNTCITGHPVHFCRGIKQPDLLISEREEILVTILKNKTKNQFFTGPLNSRVVPDTDLAGYPATDNFAGYRISGLAGYRKSGLIINIDFFLSKITEIFRFEHNLPIFMVAISLLSYT